MNYLAVCVWGVTNEFHGLAGSPLRDIKREVYIASDWACRVQWGC